MKKIYLRDKLPLTSNTQLPDDCPNCHKLVDDMDNDIHWEWSAFGQSSADTYETSTNCP